MQGVVGEDEERRARPAEVGRTLGHPSDGIGQRGEFGRERHGRRGEVVEGLLGSGRGVACSGEPTHRVVPQRAGALPIEGGVDRAGGAGRLGEDQHQMHLGTRGVPQHPLPAAFHHRAAPVEQERHVGSEPAGDRRQFGFRQVQLEEPVHRPQHRRGVGRPAAEAAAHRDPLVQPQLHRQRAAQVLLQGQVRPNGQVAGDGPVDVRAAGGLLVPEDRVPREAIRGQPRHQELVAQADAEHPGADRVHAVGLGRTHGQGEVHLGRRKDMDRIGHPPRIGRRKAVTGLAGGASRVAGPAGSENAGGGGG